MITLKPSKVSDTDSNSDKRHIHTGKEISRSYSPLDFIRKLLTKRGEKNPTPGSIAFAAALITSLAIGFLWFVNYQFIPTKFHQSAVLAIIICSFCIGYFVFSTFLKQYIYRRIKVIYKSIHKQKLPPNAKKDMVEMHSDIIDQVEKEVEEWSNSREAELEQLKTWQDYRRKFLGDISHELKTPIFNIQGFLEILLDGGLEDPSINKTYLQRAAKNVERLNTIVEDLEVISRLESGELILDMQAFDIRVLTQEVFDDLEIKAKENNIRLMFKPGADQHFIVRADREYIRQVLINLIANSIKYGNPGGVTKVGFYDMDKNILIEVADTGIGIPKEHLNHVFDRFYRVDKSRSREQGGSGLGLSIVKHIVEAHKQTINVRSTVNLGSTFGFTLSKA